MTRHRRENINKFRKLRYFYKTRPSTQSPCHEGRLTPTTIEIRLTESNRTIVIESVMVIAVLC